MAEQYDFEVLEESDVRDIVDEKLDEIDWSDKLTAEDLGIESMVDDAVCEKEDYVRNIVQEEIGKDNTETREKEPLSFTDRELHVLRTFALWVLSFNRQEDK